MLTNALSLGLVLGDCTGPVVRPYSGTCRGSLAQLVDRTGSATHNSHDAACGLLLANPGAPSKHVETRGPGNTAIPFGWIARADRMFDKAAP